MKSSEIVKLFYLKNNKFKIDLFLQKFKTTFFKILMCIVLAS